MPGLLEQHRALRARVERLERRLAQVILDLDPAAVERLAQVALSIGFTREEMEAVFGPSVSHGLQTAYHLIGTETAEAVVLPPVDTSILAQTAVASRISELTDGGMKVAQSLVQAAIDGRWEVEELARALSLMLPLTQTQNGYVANFERKLRKDRRAALRNQLRDRRFDRTLQGDAPISEEKLARMVDIYRQNWVRMRATLIARVELGRAANASQDAIYVQALRGNYLSPTVRKHWIHMHDDKVREAHVLIPEMNPDGVPVDGTFDSILGPIRYPLDPDADIANVANCRCGIVYSGLPDG